MKNKYFILTFVMACLWQAVLPSAAAEQDDRKMLSAGTPFFVPHWYVKAQGGVAYDVGEASFSQLLSPAVQLSMGYQPLELLGVRGGLSGFWARNRYAYPEAKYSWNFIQGSVDAELNLTALILGSNPERKTKAYAFLGAGVAYAFNNDEAVEADRRYGIDFQKIWKDQRWNPVLRGGLGVDYFVTDNIAIGAEVGANMLPDHFNSKRGRADNRDWHFNALVGVKFAIGYRHGRTEAVYEEVLPPPPVEKKDTFIDVPIEKISFNVNINFVINQSIIRSNQIPKLTRLLRYLAEHPRAFVRLSGYADKDTGTPEINLRLSRERAQVVSQYLQDAGIEEWRIRRFAKGDRVQPFDIPEDNRVCICFVYDPDNPVPQENW
ncbi:MAG: OmpA family protein [Prevotella sp.]|nr:OmpA family protein [Prevotella sp.]